MKRMVGNILKRVDIRNLQKRLEAAGNPWRRFKIPGGGPYTQEAAQNPWRRPETPGGGPKSLEAAQNPGGGWISLEMVGNHETDGWKSFRNGWKFFWEVVFLPTILRYGYRWIEEHLNR